jgi:hypothetical protein
MKKAFVELDPNGGDTSCSEVANHEEVVEYAASPGVRHLLEQVIFAYSAEPTDGQLTVESDGDIIWGPIWIVTGGPGPLQFSPAISVPEGQSLVVRLGAGGVDVKGSLCCMHWTQEVD